jgi:hypothetical protein
MCLCSEAAAAEAEAERLPQLEAAVAEAQVVTY